VTEISFYHLQRQPLEAVLPTLLERSLERGWRALVRVTTPERLAALDDLLWTYADESFLPHGPASDPDEVSQPILLTLEDGNPNGASVVFLGEGAPLPADLAAFERVALLFDGNDPEALGLARQQWQAVKSAGLAATYWQQADRGKWERKA
jgi:DNA polymerase-3 subunit chi